MEVDGERTTLGALFRLRYEELAKRIYGKMADQGFPDIRPAHSSLLRNIQPQGSRVVDLAEKAVITKQSMAYLTESLRAAGYVSVEPDPDDRRAKLVRLTDRGEAAVETLRTLSAEVEETLAERMGARKVEQLRSLLAEVAAVMRPDGR